MIERDGRSSRGPLDTLFRARVVDAVDAGPHARLQVLAERGAGPGNLRDRGADSLRDRDPPAIDIGSRSPRAPPEANRGAQLLLQRLVLRAQAVRSSDVVVPLGLFELGPHLCQALAVGAPRLIVEHLAGIAQAADDTHAGAGTLG